ncbi:serine/threonine-protein phosphatase 4 regulatory subunit 2-B isoform X1 [Lepisosteus oculatus]|uniref:serine/threonine-protein phosphatase 4 regulatory subunit 2-B isoform X1 n=1 Tax=Lepisosteus oculatus TaxID=7918 RepID=UPI00371FF77C
MEIDTLLEALKDFEKKGKKDVCPTLDQFLCHVAKTGETMIQWSQFKSYFLFKLEKVMDDFRASAPEQRGPANPNVEYIPFEEMKERILKIVNGYNGIPFTIQRLCELLTEPKRNYTGTDKFLRGVEKNVMVVSCVYPTSEKNGSSSLSRMNGVMFPGNSSGYSDRNVNGPGTPRPMNRPKLSLSSSLATNGLPDSTENKEPTAEQADGKPHSESPSSEGENTLGSPVKNKYLEEEEDPMEAEGHEVKRLKFDQEEEALRPAAAESTAEMPEEAESSSEAQEGEKESSRDAELQSSEEQEPSSTQTETPAGESTVENAEKETLSATEDTSEENNQMDQSDQPSPLDKDLSREDREPSENIDPVSSSSSSSSSSSNSEESSESGEPETASSSKSPETPSENAMENSTEATETAEEPMEQD